MKKIIVFVELRFDQHFSDIFAFFINPSRLLSTFGSFTTLYFISKGYYTVKKVNHCY